MNKRQYKQSYYLENRERINKHAKEFRLQNPNLIMYQRIKGKAKRLGLPFDLSLEDIVIPERCPVLDVPFVFGKRSEWNPSLDRLIPDKGYVKGNVVIISKRANLIKSNSTTDELRLIADFVDLLLVSRFD